MSSLLDNMDCHIDVGPEEDFAIVKTGENQYKVAVVPPVSIEGKRSIFFLDFEAAASPDAPQLDTNTRYNLRYNFAAKGSVENGDASIEILEEEGISFRRSPEFGRFEGERMDFKITNVVKFTPK